MLAPFWTNLNPAAGRGVRIALLTDGYDTWIVVDWEAVPESSLPRLNSFEVWIGVSGDAHPAEDISFAYGTIQGNGDGGLLTVGAENWLGDNGQAVYYNGTGTLPTNGDELRVTTAPVDLDYCDEDGDGIEIPADQRPDSVLGGNVDVNGAETGTTSILNNLDATTGCTLQDQADGVPTTSHAVYVDGIAVLANDWYKAGLITKAQRQEMINMAAKSSVGK